MEKQYFEILLEEINGNVQLVLEGHGQLVDRMDKMGQRMDRIEHRMDSIDQRMDRMEYQQGMMVTDIKDIKQNVGLH
jgi:DNA anti-recombination protein RmuC